MFHPHTGSRGSWQFCVIVPVLVCGTVASLWQIVRGALGVFGRTGPKARIVGDSRATDRRRVLPSTVLVWLATRLSPMRELACHGLSATGR